MKYHWLYRFGVPYPRESGNLSGRTFRLKITGADVTSDDAGCGTDSMRVHLAYFWEDSARDDASGGGIGPNYDIDHE